MPVTAKLSQKFYDKFGDDIANEFVTWFNMIDATYKIDLRDLNDRNFQRFEAKLAQALAEQSASLNKEMGEQGVALRKEMGEQAVSLRKEIADLCVALRAEIAQQGISLRQEIADLRKEVTGQTRWIFGLWAVQIMTFVGTILAVLQQ